MTRNNVRRRTPPASPRGVPPSRFRRPRHGRHKAELVVLRLYETRLAHFIASHPCALGSARRMIAAARSYIEARAELTAQSEHERRLEVTRLLRRCGRALDDPFTGRVGFAPEKLSSLFSGHGNLRELMAHVWSFASNLLCHDLVGARPFSRWPEAAESAGFDFTAIETMIRRAEEFHQRPAEEHPGARPELDANRDFLKMPWHPVRHAQKRMRIRIAEQDVKSSWSTMTRAEFEAAGGMFSGAEAELTSGLGRQYVPWLDSSRIWSLEDSSRWVREASKAGIPLVSGISGVTMQLLQVARILNTGPLEDVRLACLGYLMSTGAHSFHEVMAAAETFGCAYDHPGDYLEIPPLSSREILRACGAAPRDRPGPGSCGRSCARPRGWPARVRRHAHRSPSS